MNLIHCVIKGNAPVHKHSENTSYNNINCIACTINALLHQNKIRCIKFSVCSKGDKSSFFQICLTRPPWIFQWHSSSRWCAIWHWHSLVAHSCIEDNKHVPKHLFQKEGKDLQNVNRQVWTQNCQPVGKRNFPSTCITLPPECFIACIFSYYSVW